MRRSGSPPGSSTFTTSAPKSPRMAATAGPENRVDRSRTRSPTRAPSGMHDGLALQLAFPPAREADRVEAPDPAADDDDELVGTGAQPHPTVRVDAPVALQ